MDVGSVLLDILVVLIAAKLAAEIAERINVPAVVGEIVAGVIIGPSILGFVGSNETLSVLGELGVILLLLGVGMEMDIADLGAVGRSALSVASIGVIVPMAGGYVVASALGHSSNQSLFIGAALAATSVGITARVFSDLRALATVEARTVLGAAVIDDVLGLVILTVVVGSCPRAGSSWPPSRRSCSRPVFPARDARRPAPAPGVFESRGATRICWPARARVRVPSGSPSSPTPRSSPRSSARSSPASRSPRRTAPSRRILASSLESAPVHPGVLRRDRHRGEPGAARRARGAGIAAALTTVAIIGKLRRVGRSARMRRATSCDRPGHGPARRGRPDLRDHRAARGRSSAATSTPLSCSSCSRPR